MLYSLLRAHRARNLVVSAGFATTKLSQAIRNFTRSLATGRAGRRASVPAFEMLENRQLMSTTYYVSPSGSDSNSGKTSSAAFKTIAKVNSLDLNAGDSVLFQGGQTFYGSLNIGSKDAGNSTTPVTFGSYNGRATINSGGSNGATVTNASGVWFENLKFVGSPSGGQQSGIDINGYTKGTYYTNDRVDNCDISGYLFSGILSMAAYSNGGISGLRITNNAVYNNVDCGIQIASGYMTGEVNPYIAYNTVHDNYGDGHSVCTGSGIELGGVTGALVEHNASYNNGAKGGAGEVGIWAYNANQVTFQYNESYDNHTTNNTDGDGFDFDADVENSVMQYNYAFGNDGTGAQFDQWKNDSTFTNNTMRYNIFQDNGRKNNYGNIELWGKVLNSYVYNNVIYTTPGNSGTNAAIQIRNNTLPGLYVTNAHFVNNIIDTTGGTKLINVTSSEAAGAKGITFTGNIYWTNGSSVNITYGSNYKSLSAFEATGQEKWNGKTVGIFADPKFASSNSVYAVPAASTNALASAAAGYKLLSGSPAYSQSLSVTSMYGIATGGTDFYGNTIASNAATVAGAYQALAASSQNNVGSTPSSTSSSGSSSSSSGSSGASSGSSSTGTTSSTAGVSGLHAYDIGPVGLSGSNSAANGTYTVTASGADIQNTSDELRFDETSLTGDGTIIVELDSMTNANSWAKAGVMIRSGLTANAQEVSVLTSPNGQASFQSRSTSGGSTSATNVTSTDKWFKLVRSGNTFSGYISSNGSSWTEIGSSTVAMGSTVDIGLAVTSHTNSARETAVFNNLSIASGTGTAAPSSGVASGSSSSSTSGSSTSTTSSTGGVSGMHAYDIGSVGLSGSNAASNGVYTITAAGADIFDNNDAFRYDETSLTGNGTIIAKVDSLTDANDWAKAGVMIRSSLAANASEVSMLISPNKQSTYETRATNGASTTSAHSTSQSWVKLVRSGNTFTGYVSSNGTSWTEVSSTTVDMGSSVLIGLAVTSHTTSARETAVFSNLSIT